MKKKFLLLLVTLCILFGAMYVPTSYAEEICTDKQTQSETFEKNSDNDAVQPAVLGGTIADGTYYIKNCYSNKYLTANGGSISGGTRVVQTEKLAGDAALPQLWRIYHLGNEQYTIRPFHKLDMTMGRTAQDIDLAYRGATDEELTDIAKWRMTQASTGWYLSLYGYASNYVMSLETASNSNGIRITFAQKSNSASKMWILESIPTAPTGVALYNTQSWIAPGSTATFKASVYSGSTINQSVTWSSSNTNVATVSNVGVVTGKSAGTAVITAKSKVNTSWFASYTVNVGEIANGTYYIKSKQSGKVVDIKDSNTTAGESIHQFDFEGTNDQKWIFELQQDGYYTIKSVHSNLYLSVKDNASNSGADVIQNSGGNADGQRWSVTKTNNGAYKIKAKCAGSLDLCLKKGTYVFYPNKLVHMTYSDDSTYDDEWEIYYVGKNRYKLLAYDDTNANRCGYFSSVYSKIKAYLGDDIYTNYYTSISNIDMKQLLTDSDIFIVHTHGKKDGFMIAPYEYLSMSNMNGLNLANLKFALLLTCNTGDDFSDVHIENNSPVNIAEKMVCLGAETVVGFNSITYVSDCNKFAIDFIYNAVVAKKTVTDAIRHIDYDEYLKNMYSISVIGGNKLQYLNR